MKLVDWLVIAFCTVAHTMTWIVIAKTWRDQWRHAGWMDGMGEAMRIMRERCGETVDEHVAGGDT